MGAVRHLRRSGRQPLDAAAVPRVLRLVAAATSRAGGSARLPACAIPPGAGLLLRGLGQWRGRPGRWRWASSPGPSSGSSSWRRSSGGLSRSPGLRRRLGRPSRRVGPSGPTPCALGDRLASFGAALLVVVVSFTAVDPRGRRALLRPHLASDRAQRHRRGARRRLRLLARGRRQRAPHPPRNSGRRSGVAHRTRPVRGVCSVSPPASRSRLAARRRAHLAVPSARGFDRRARREIIRAHARSPRLRSRDAAVLPRPPGRGRRHARRSGRKHPVDALGPRRQAPVEGRADPHRGSRRPTAATPAPHADLSGEPAVDPAR